jgi:hypothetical protein
MYSNIPVKETKLILEDILHHNSIDHHTKTELLNWYGAITQQNYFTHIIIIIILQKDGLAMGSPSFGLISETFLQKLEHTELPNIAPPKNSI